jgi:hypothetical protein
MDVPTLTMNPDLAQVEFDKYRAAIDQRNATAEDVQILDVYRALAAGKNLLDLNQVFRTCPLTPTGLPKLAVARASWRWCWFKRDRVFTVFGANSSATYVNEWKPSKPRNQIRFRTRFFPEGTKGEARALVPLIPLSIRPNGLDLSRFFILFEAEWLPIPPRDPLLLSRLSGSIYVILAAWNLTEVERAVLAGRFVEGGQ